MGSNVIFVVRMEDKQGKFASFLIWYLKSILYFSFAAKDGAERYASFYLGALFIPKGVWKVPLS